MPSVDIDTTEDASYWTITKRPLQILAFLAPLVLLFEVSLALVLPRSGIGEDESGRVLTVLAHEKLVQFFTAFGIEGTSSLYLGGVAIVVVLFVWHLLNRDPWKVSLPAVGGMALEALLLTAPLIILAQLVIDLTAPAALFAFQDSATTEETVRQLDIASRIAISVGAGLYEELLFRMLLIAVVHTLLVDAMKMSEFKGMAIAVLVSAVAFTIYHPLTENGSISTARVAFFFLAGLYFGVVYVVRGFGVVVGVHALYDVMTVLLAGSAEG